MTWRTQRRQASFAIVYAISYAISCAASLRARYGIPGTDAMYCGTAGDVQILRESQEKVLRSAMPYARATPSPLCPMRDLRYTRRITDSFCTVSQLKSRKAIAAGARAQEEEEKKKFDQIKARARLLQKRAEVRLFALDAAASSHLMRMPLRADVDDDASSRCCLFKMMMTTTKIRCLDDALASRHLPCRFTLRAHT
eukprot:92763-Rhodomonas_salina.4